MGTLTRAMQDPSIICESCNHEVRPVSLDLGADLTCPYCGECVMGEVNRYNQRYGLKKLFDDEDDEDMGGQVQ